MDSDESDFYVGEHPPNHVPSRAIIMEIGKFEHENDDQEVALKDLRNGVKSESSCTITPEEAPVNESKNNGELRSKKCNCRSDA